MTVTDWLEKATADARRRGLEGLVPLLENVGRTMDVLRTTDWRTCDNRGDGRATGDSASALAGGGAGSTAPDVTVPPGVSSIAGLAGRIARGDERAERVTEDCLARITELNPALNAFVTITADEALARARGVDKAVAQGQAQGSLAGVPIALKDIVDLAGVLTTASSNVRRDHRAARDAVVTARLREAGAIFVGKTNLHEFALGTTNEESAFGPARNPFDRSRSPGGSSGGSAVAVATGMAWAAVGTDTGGSIRIPSAACGLVGLKPQWGDVSADGVVPLSRQFDHVGPIARSVADAWLLYDVMRGAAIDPRRQPAADHTRGLRIGIPKGYLFDRLDADVESVVLGSIETLRRAGVTVVDVEVPLITATPHVYLLLGIADAAAYHARDLEQQPEFYTVPVRLRLEMGRYMMAEDYSRALEGKAALTRSVDAALGEVDVLVLPALSIPAPPIGAATMPVKGGEEPVRAAMLRCTQPFNVTGHPAISLPCGRTSAGLPIGLQLVGRRQRTTALLAVALGVERAIASA